MKKIYLFAMAAMVAVSMNAKNAFLLLESSISNLPEEKSVTDLGEIAENPEQNAANWYNTQFVNKEEGVLIGKDDIKNALANGISCIWVNIDRQDLDDIQTAGITDGVIADLKAFVEAGGNLFLTKQACKIAHRIGRIYDPTWGNGDYSVGGDIWSINPQVGLWWTLADSRRDNSDHPIYEGIDTIQVYSATMEEGAENVPYGTFPLVGMVPRCDRNIAWLDYFRKDPNDPTTILTEDEAAAAGIEIHYANDNPLRLPDFENDWNVKVLGIWGHVQDFCGGVIVEMNPDGEFQGKVLAIGASAYQWGSSNDYIGNVKKLTRNALNYLTEEEQGIESTEAAVKTSKMIENGQMIIMKNGMKYNALGTQVK